MQWRQKTRWWFQGEMCTLYQFFFIWFYINLWGESTMSSSQQLAWVTDPQVSGVCWIFDPWLVLKTCLWLNFFLFECLFNSFIFLLQFCSNESFSWGVNNSFSCSFFFIFVQICKESDNPWTYFCREQTQNSWLIQSLLWK